MAEKIVIYNAAALFDWPNQGFNIRLTEELERIGYEVILPQRDGFEFANLLKAFEGILPEKDIPNATNRIIYFLDIGEFIGKRSNIVLARLDEPIDEGVVKEICFAKTARIPIIGYRTSITTPFGPASGETRGAHFFPPYTCDNFFLISPSFRTSTEEKSKLEQFAGGISSIVQDINPLARIFDYNKQIPDEVEDAVRIAKTLFSGVSNIHSENSLRKIAGRYAENIGMIEAALPQIIRI